jgi:hypothetical protein
MLNFFSVISNKNKKNMNGKVIYTLFYVRSFESKAALKFYCLAFEQQRSKSLKKIVD